MPTISRLPKIANTMIAIAAWKKITPNTAAAVVVFLLIALAPMEGRAGVRVIIAKQGYAIPHSHQVGEALLSSIVGRTASTLLKSAFVRATMPMMTENSAMKGPIEPMISVSLRRPNQTVITEATAIRHAPIRGSQSRYWLRVVPAPLSMIR